MCNNWQASLGYSLSAGWDYQYPPVDRAGCDVRVDEPVAGRVHLRRADHAAPGAAVRAWSDAGDQLHRLTFNGIWQLPYGFQASGLYFFGDNGKATPVSGVDVLGDRRHGHAGTDARPAARRTARSSSATASTRLDIHRVGHAPAEAVHARLARGRRGMLEVFNLFNHANYNSFVTNESSAQLRRPRASTATSRSSRGRAVRFPCDVLAGMTACRPGSRHPEPSSEPWATEDAPYGLTEEAEMSRGLVRHPGGLRIACWRLCRCRRTTRWRRSTTWTSRSRSRAPSTRWSSSIRIRCSISTSRTLTARRRRGYSRPPTPARCARAGWRATGHGPGGGATYTVKGFAARNGNPMGFLRVLVFPDKKEMVFWFGDPND